MKNASNYVIQKLPDISLLGQDDAAVEAERWRESLAGRRAKRKKRHLTLLMRRQRIPDEWDLILTGWEEGCRERVQSSLEINFGFSAEASKEAVERVNMEGFKVVRESKSPKEIDVLEKALQDAGGYCERQQ